MHVVEQKVKLSPLGSQLLERLESVQARVGASGSVTLGFR
jgi:hypothetical protein